MGFFYTPPKRLTPDEINGTHGLLSGKRGVLSELHEKGNVRINDHERDILKAIIEGYEKPNGRMYNGISNKELPDVMKAIRDSKEFSKEQIERIEKEFKERI
jgi:hypothetical protein